MLECVQPRAQGGAGGIGGPLDPSPQHREGKVLDCGQLRQEKGFRLWSVEGLYPNQRC